jgi:hypothetical protein
VIKKLISFFVMSRDARWYDKHPTILARFEEIEDWLEHIEDRVAALEEIAHPKCGIESFDGYKPLIERINKLEVIVTVLKKENDDRQ